MNQIKAYGRVASFTGENGIHARIEILSFRRNGQIVTDLNEIKEQFPPSGHVFAPNFAERFIYSEGCLIELTVGVRLGSYDKRVMDIDKECKPVGFPIIDVSASILVNEKSINQPILWQLISRDFSHFYIASASYTYGPFKSSEGNVVPRVGTTVKKYALQEKQYEYEGVKYILHEPTGELEAIDCMTTSQLYTFFKEFVRKSNLEIDVNGFKTVIESEAIDGLDKYRLLRLCTQTEKIKFSSSLIKDMAEHSPKFQLLFEKGLQTIKDELREEYSREYIAKKEEISREVDVHRETLAKLKMQIDKAEAQLRESEHEYKEILQGKERLIQDIRMQSMIKDGELLSHLPTYDVRNFEGTGEKYSSLNSFNECYQNEILYAEVSEKEKFANCLIHALKYHKCFLVKKVEAVIQFAVCSNNAKVFLQQVEPDWLKFENLYRNGLKEVWRSSIDNPSMFHLFVLEDLNMSSFECYGRPVLDILSGLRRSIPGFDTGWPDNLWLFGIPLGIKGDHEFGLPLIKSTYNSWCCLPDSEGLEFSLKCKTDKHLPIEMIAQHNSQPTSFSEEYFSK